MMSTHTPKPHSPDVARISSPPDFLSKYAALFDLLLRANDLVCVLLAGLLMHGLRFGARLQHPYDVELLHAGLLVLLIFPACGLYRSWRGMPFHRELGRIAMAMGVVAGLMLLIAWALKTTEDFSRLWFASWYVASVLLLGANRLLVRGALRLVRTHGMDSRSVVLIGGTAAAQRVVQTLAVNPWLGMRVQGYVATPFDQSGTVDLPCLGHLEAFLERIATNCPDQIWIALPLRAEPLIERILESTADTPTTVRLVPDMLGYELINHDAHSVAGMPVITLRGSRVEGHARVLKAIEDRTLAACFLLLFAPLMLLIAVAVKLSSPGPVFYKQKRMGLDGREFDMLKFRSMRVDAEKNGMQWGNAAHKPTTAIGGFLRRTSLDELPQFINVLKGDLSIVGPRPERPAFVHEFKKNIPGYMQKHLVKGGITGWAQINGWRGDTDLRKRIEHDLYYIQNWSLWLDIKIIILTPLAILRRTNAY